MELKPISQTTALPNTASDAKKYRLGVALSGGGARGIAHAGALLAIEHAGYTPEVVAGVSAGSVVAVLYSAGIRPIQIAEMFATTGFRDFANVSFGGGGLFDIEKFKNFIMRRIGKYRNIEDLPIPTYICATDLDHACPVAFDSGAIGPRMIASCSIPIVFRPVVINGVHYVDGGVLRNHPAWVLRDKCETLIGVNVSPLKPAEDYNSIISVAMRTYNLMAKANQVADMAICDVSVSTPEIVNNAVFSLKNIKELFLAGYFNTRNALIDANMWKVADDLNNAQLPR